MTFIAKRRLGVVTRRIFERGSLLSKPFPKLLEETPYTAASALGFMEGPKEDDADFVTPSGPG
jgi:hypothetical protein